MFYTYPATQGYTPALQSLPKCPNCFGVDMKKVLVEYGTFWQCPRCLYKFERKA